MALRPKRVRASSFTRLLRHTQRRTTVGRTPLDEAIDPSQRPLPNSTQLSQQAEIYATGGTRTRYPSKHAAADIRLIPRGHWDRQIHYVTIEMASVWRCSRHPSSCDIESSGHTTRRRAEVLPVFARSCHSLYRCRRDILWIKYR